MSRTTRYAVLAGFSLFMSLPLVAALLGFRSTPVENRPLASPPHLSASSLLSVRTYEDIDDFLTDRMPLRSQAISAANWIEYAVFATSPNPEVSLGEGGWLFFTEEISQECLSSDRLEGIVAEIALLGDAVRASGREFRFFVAPDKSAAHPARLGPLEDDILCAVQNRSRLRRLLAGLPGAVDLWDAFDGERHYHRTDSHWNTAGAAVAAETLLASLDPGAWDGDLVVEPDKSRRGDLMGHMGIPMEELVQVVAPARPVAAEVIVDDRQLLAAASRSPRPEAIPGVAAFLHDSFGEVMDPFLRPAFAELRSVWFYGDRFVLANPRLRDLLAGTDLVVVGTVNRDLYEGFSHPLGLEMVAALAADLPGFAAVPGSALPAGGRAFVVAEGAGEIRLLTADGALVAGIPVDAGHGPVAVRVEAPAAVVDFDPAAIRVRVVMVPPAAG